MCLPCAAPVPPCMISYGFILNFILYKVCFKISIISDTCEGDGGSPLACPLIEDPERKVQVGIVAWGLGCGKENVPGVYASVADGICFIKNAAECRSVNYNEYFEDIKNCNRWKASYQEEINSEIQKWTLATELGLFGEK